MKTQIAGYILKSNDGRCLTRDFFWTEVENLDDADAFSPEETTRLVVQSLVDDWEEKVYSIIPVIKVEGKVVAHLKVMLVSSLVKINLYSSD